MEFVSELLNPLLAQVSSPLLTQLGQTLQILMMFGFIIGTAMIITGGINLRRTGGEEGKLSIVGGILVAAAPALMFALYSVFGLGSSIPLFK